MKIKILYISFILIVSCQIEQKEQHSSDAIPTRSELKEIIIKNFKSPIQSKKDTLRISTHSVFQCIVGEDMNKWIILDDRNNDFIEIKREIGQDYQVIQEMNSYKVYDYNVLGKLIEVNRYIVFEEFYLKQFDSNPPTILEHYSIETEYQFQLDIMEWKKIKRSVT